MGIDALSPELRLHIASFLGGADAVSLARTHSSWQDAGEAAVWREVDMTNPEVPEIWWTNGHTHNLEKFQRACYLRLFNAILRRPVRAAMIRRFACMAIDDTSALIVDIVRRCSAKLRVFEISSLTTMDTGVEDTEIHLIYAGLDLLPACPCLVRAQIYVSSQWYLEVPTVLRLAPNLVDIRIDGDEYGDRDLASLKWPSSPKLRTIRVPCLMDVAQKLIDKMLSVAPGVREIVGEAAMDAGGSLDFSGMCKHDGLRSLYLRPTGEDANSVIGDALTRALSRSTSKIELVHSAFPNHHQPFLPGPNLRTVIWDPSFAWPRDPHVLDSVELYKADLLVARTGAQIGWLRRVDAAPKLERICILGSSTDNISTAIQPSDIEAYLDISTYTSAHGTVYELDLWENLSDGGRYKIAGVVMYNGRCVSDVLWRQVVAANATTVGGPRGPKRDQPLSDEALRLLEERL